MKKFFSLRKSNIELLRIISMLMIIGVHWLGSSKAEISINHNSISYLIFVLVMSVCNLGVNIFALITGYFMITFSEVSIKKIIKLLLDVLIYGIVFYFVSVLLKINSLSLGGFLKAGFPILAGYRWFVKAYIVLYLLIPFLNKVLNQITKKQYTTFLIIMIMLFSIWPSFFPNPPIDDYGYGFIHLILMYTIAGFIRKFGLDLSKKKMLFLFCICILSTSVVHIGNFGFLGVFISYSWAYNSPLNIIAAVSLFGLFLKINFQSNIINIFSSSAFAVFLIHGDYNIMDFLFNNVFRASTTYDNIKWVPYMFIAIVIIYIVCSIIDFIKRIVIDSWLVNLLNKIKIINYKINI